MITPVEFSLTPSEVAENMVFIVDVGTRQIEFASQLAHINLGYGKGELMELKIDDLHPLEMEEMQGFMRVVIVEKEASTDSLNCIAKDGQVLPSVIFAKIMSLNDRRYLVAKVVLKEQ